DEFLTKPISDLKISKSVSVADPEVGSEVTFTMTVTNDGPSKATNIKIIDRLPAGYSYVNSSDAGVYDADDHEVRWTIAELENGASISRSVRVLVQASGSYKNVATVSA